MECRAREVEKEFEIDRLKEFISNNGIHMAMLAKENHFLRMQLDARTKIGLCSCGIFFTFLLCLLMDVVAIVVMFGDSCVSNGKKALYLPL